MRQLLSIAAGVATACMVGFANFSIAKSGFDFSALIILFFVPAGAMLLGMPAGFAFSFFSHVSNESAVGSILRLLLLLLVLPVLGALSLAVHHYLLFSSLGLLADGTSFADAFSAYFDAVELRTRMGGVAIGEPGPALGILTYAGAAIGGLLGISGMFASPAFQSEKVTRQVKSVASIAIHLALADGEMDPVENECCLYVTKLALGHLAKKAARASRAKQESRVESIYDEAYAEVNSDALYKDVIDRCAAEIGRDDMVLNHLVAFGLAAVISKDVLGDVNTSQLTLLAYAMDQLGVPRDDMKRQLGYGFTLRAQLLRGELTV